MSGEPAQPNKPLLRSAAKMRQLEEQVQAHQALLGFIHEHIKVPIPKLARFESMCVHQYEIASWVKAALHDPSDPAFALEFLEAHWPEPPYEVES